MKELKHFRNSWLILALLFAVVACNDNNDEDFKVDGDAVFIKKKINDEIVYATAFYAYGNKSIDTATVTVPNGGGTVALNAFEGYTYTFVYEPKNDDFSTDFPVPGGYIFEATNTNGETVEASDEQGYDNLGFVEIDSLEFDSDNAGLYLKWNVVSGADSYVVRLFNSSGEMIYNGFTIDGETPEYFVSDYYNTGTWAAIPEKGKNYDLRVQSMKYDSDATTTNFGRNIQEICVTQQQITWELD